MVFLSYRYKECREFVLATLLDPRYKDVYFADREKKLNVGFLRSLVEAAEVLI